MTRQKFSLLFDKFNEEYDSVINLEESLNECNNIEEGNLIIRYNVYKDLETSNITTEIMLKDDENNKFYKLTTVSKRS